MRRSTARRCARVPVQGAGGQDLDRGRTAEAFDYGELNDLVGECEKLNKKDNTAESWKTFNGVLTIAIGVQVNTEATQTEINEVVTQLREAKKALVLCRNAEAKRCCCRRQRTPQCLADKGAAKDEIVDAWKQLTSLIHMQNFTSDKTAMAALVSECE